MKILITGGKGYLGIHLVKAFEKLNFEILVLDIKKERSIEDISKSLFRQLDINHLKDFERILKIFKPEIVFHLAAKKNVVESFSLPEEYLRFNSEITYQLADISNRVGVSKFIFISSAAVYGSPKKTEVSEVHECLPTSPYGLSKLLAEEKLREGSKEWNMKVSCIRLFNLFGYDPNLVHLFNLSEGDNFQSYICRAITSGKPIRVFRSKNQTSDGTTERDYIHPNDASRALVNLALKDSLNHFDIVNLGTGVKISSYELARVSSANFKDGIQIILEPARDFEVDTIVANVNYIRDVLGNFEATSSSSSLTEFIRPDNLSFPHSG